MGYVAKDETTVAQRKHMKDIHIGRVWGIVNRDEYKEHIVLVDADVGDIAEKIHFCVELMLQFIGLLR